ncbi:MAG TPA: hypothetical protein VGQ89_08495 [Candidatus Limnocylindrales bacterium]|nr:hypothetical protein [Candidatus Limnocylindrales bacterium]
MTLTRAPWISFGGALNGTKLPGRPLLDRRQGVHPLQNPFVVRRLS